MPSRGKASLASVRARIAALKRPHRFVSWRYSSELASELRDLLHDAEQAVGDPRTGAELLLRFYETDCAVFDQCDDSSGHIGSVYRFDAQQLFVRYAKDCPDTEWLVDRLFGLMEHDDYGVRDALLEVAPRYLSKAQIHRLVARMREADAALPDNKRGTRWRVDIETLARAMKDGALFAEARLSYPGPIYAGCCVDIAKVYLSAGEAAVALGWLEKIPADDMSRDGERDELLASIFAALGEREKQTEVVWRIFRRYRSATTLSALLALVGKKARAKIVADEAAAIMAAPRFVCSDARFLFDAGHSAEAEACLVSRAEGIDGEYYPGLLPLAEALLGVRRPLAATIIYRALADSILARARSKIYGHAVRYLGKLERIAKDVDDWRGLPDHAAYVAALRSRHARKSAFWSRFGE